ncbi:vdac-1 [Pristionchus pacificus]|uniref:Vdac-1 n=1 Tax=Pristionchus pacificus TaxID=54126 RepID=A0A2A6BH84_PRIPA|nr:vdac-1 [Pristionchus pacificus]|eukprot:PDM65252.1 vdac-1 [Pristionchus pacificus]
MAPPTFADLGKSAKDLFSKGYNVGLLKIDSTSKAGEKNDVEFKVASTHNIASGKLGGNFDVKYKVPQYGTWCEPSTSTASSEKPSKKHTLLRKPVLTIGSGLRLSDTSRTRPVRIVNNVAVKWSIPKYGVTLTEKWNTDNQLGTVIEVAEQFGRGLKVTLDSTYAPHSGKRSGKLKADWSLPTARLTTDVALTTAPVVNAAAVFQRESFLIGASVTFDTATNKMTNSQLAFGQATKEYTLHSHIVNSNEFGASLFHKVAPNTEIGATLGWKVGGTGTVFAVATKYSPSRDVTFRAKLNNESQFGAAVQHTLSNSLILNLSTQMNLASNEGHKFGLGLEFTPSN